MIALNTYAHHFDRPAIESTQIRTAASENWRLAPVARSITPVREIFADAVQVTSKPKQNQADTAGAIRIGSKTYFPVASVYFEIGSAAVSVQADHTLRGLPRKRYVLVGFASKPSTYALNVQLATQRALAIGAQMEKDGFPSPGLASMGSVGAKPWVSKYPGEQRVTVYQEERASPPNG